MGRQKIHKLTLRTALPFTCRIFAFTKLNAHSSRSHCIVMLTVIKRHKAPTEVAEHVQRVKIGKLFLVDLAGSERLKRSGSTGASSSLACLSSKHRQQSPHAILLCRHPSCLLHVTGCIVHQCLGTELSSNLAGVGYRQPLAAVAQASKSASLLQVCMLQQHPGP